MAQNNGLRFDLSGFVNGMTDFEDKFLRAVLMYANTEAVRLESYMKQNRKWTDRSGAAKQRLRGRAYNIAPVVRIELSHGVDYGIWLELANEKRFAIVEPTIRLKGPEVIEGLEDLMNKMKS